MGSKLMFAAHAWPQLEASAASRRQCCRIHAETRPARLQARGSAGVGARTRARRARAYCAQRNFRRLSVERVPRV